MNKNLKVISSIAMAGILAATGISTVSAATTRSLGVYRKLVDGKTVVPYVLSSSSDKIEASHINSEFGVTLSSGTVVKTGTTFSKDGKTHNVLVYGDVGSKDNTTKADGKVDSNDANLMLKLAVATDKSALVDDVNLEAADIVNDGKIDSNDANLALQFAVGKGSIDVKLIPEKEEEENYDYTIAEVNDGNVINNQNETATFVYVKPKVTPTASKTLNVKVSDKNGVVAGATGTVTITVDKTVSLFKNASGINVSTAADGDITIELVDPANDKTVGKTVVKKYAGENVATAKANVYRNGSHGADMSLTNIGDSEIVKIHYLMRTSSSIGTDDTVAEVLAENDVQTVEKNIAVGANAELKGIKSRVDEAAYYVNYIVEDIHGNMSTPKEIILASDDATAYDPVTSVVAPTMNAATAEYTWTVDAGTAKGTKFGVVLYRGTEIVFEDIVTYDNTDANTIANTTKYDFTSKMNEEGSYSVGVTVLASTTNAKSAEVKTSDADTRTISKLASVSLSSIVMNENNSNKRELTWTDSNTQSNIKYVVTLEKFNDSTNVWDPVDLNGASDGTDLVIANGTKKVVFDDILGVTISADSLYRASVVAKIDGQYLVQPADKAETPEYYEVSSATVNSMTDVTESSLVLNLSNIIKINGVNATYGAEVRKIVSTSDIATGGGVASEEFKNATVEVDGTKIKIGKLDPNSEYAIKVTATVNGVKGESAWLRTVSSAKIKTSPVVSELKVVKDPEKLADKTVYLYTDAEGVNKMVINGDRTKEISYAVANEYSADFKALVGLISQLNEGDVISISGKNVTLALTGKAATLALGTAGADATFTITGNNYVRTITSTDGSEPEEVILQGDNAVFNVAGLNANKITLKDGVEVIGANTKEYTLGADTTATVNGIKVNTKLATTVRASVYTADEKTIQVAVTSDRNELTFTNLAGEYLSTDNATIQFVSESGLPIKQLGTITITSETGSVKVTQDSHVDVNASLNIEVTDGTVDVTDTNLTGTKNITAKAGTEVTVTPKVAISGALTDVEIKDYAKDDTTLTTLAATYSGTTANATSKAAVKTIVDAFRMDKKENVLIKDGYAKLTAVNTAADGSPAAYTKVTIHFNKDVDNFNLSNLAGLND